jgi:hypothetical protein
MNPIHKIKSILWRDPDPLWRWFSGHLIRPVRDRPGPFAASATILLGMMPFVVVLGPALLAHLRRDPTAPTEQQTVMINGFPTLLPPALDFFSVLIEYTNFLFDQWAGMWLMFLGSMCMSAVYIFFSLSKKISPPSVLQELRQTMLSDGEIGNMMMLGGFRYAALPLIPGMFAFALSVGLVYVFWNGALNAFYDIIVSGQSIVSFLALVLWIVLLPPLELCTIIPIFQWLRFKTGLPAVAAGIGALLIQIVVLPFPVIVAAAFPPLSFIAAFLIALAMTLWTLFELNRLKYGRIRTYLAATIVAISVSVLLNMMLGVLASPIGGILPLNINIFAVIPLAALQIRIAHYCYKDFLQNWPEYLERNFSA